MILLDTHIWIWWVCGSPDLPDEYADLIQERQSVGLLVSTISVWEVAKLVEKERLSLSVAVENWIEVALEYPGVQLVPLSPEIAIASTQLPQPFHKDPADQIIVATSRVLGAPLLTRDHSIRDYPHVTLAL